MHLTRLLTILLVSFLVSATADLLEAQTITHVPVTFDGVVANSVSGAGDVNGDGFDDLIVSGGGVFSGSDNSVLNSFEVNSVSGAGDVNGDGLDDFIVGSDGSARVLSGSDGTILHNFDGANAGDQFGFSVSGAGDVNADGTPDLIVGSPSGGANGGGYARVLSGSNGSILYQFDGDSAGVQFGISVSGAGDVNGDGSADLIVGANSDDSNGTDSGAAVVLSGSNGSVLFNFDGDSAGDFFGSSVSGAGDVNGDGFADLIVGATGDDNNGSNSGSARVFSGSNGVVIYNFDGDNLNDQLGFSVSGAGDVNGDATPDLIVGVFGVNGFSGSARVLSGSDGSVLYNFNGDNVADGFGISVSDAGDVNGDGVGDFIVGSVGDYARVFVSQVPAPDCLLGDVDLSGTVDFLDIQPFIGVLSGGTNQCEADCDQNGTVEFLDIQPFIAILSGGL